MKNVITALIIPTRKRGTFGLPYPSQILILSGKNPKERISKEGIPIRHFSDAYLETLAVYRKIADYLLSCDTLLFHGSVIAVDGEGYLFTAKSGTGKSTHTRLWREYFGERAVMVNDDKPLLHITDSGVTAYGTPWDGKHRLSSNIAVPLKGICILTRDIKNHIEQADPHAAYPMIVQQTNRPLTADGMKQTLSLIDRMLNVVPVYRSWLQYGAGSCKGGL